MRHLLLFFFFLILVFGMEDNTTLPTTTSDTLETIFEVSKAVQAIMDEDPNTIPSFDIAKTKALAQTIEDTMEDATSYSYLNDILYYAKYLPYIGFALFLFKELWEVKEMLISLKGSFTNKISKKEKVPTEDEMLADMSATSARIGVLLDKLPILTESPKEQPKELSPREAVHSHVHAHRRRSNEFLHTLTSKLTKS